MNNYFNDVNLNNTRFKTFFVFILISIISFTIYVNSLNNKFVFDDKYIVVKNSFIKHIKSLPKIFKYDALYFAPEHFNYYRPIAIISYALNYRIGKLNPFGYHLGNILFHSLNSFLLFFLLTALFQNFNLALMSSILFAIHPIQTSCVNFIVARDSLLATFFGLLSIIGFLFFIKLNNKLYYILSLLFFTLSLLSRESGLLFIPLIALCAIKMKENKINITKKLLPFIVICLLYIFLRLFIVKIPFTISSSRYHLNLVFEILNFFNIIFGYLRLLISPFNLHVKRFAPFLLSLVTFKSILIIIFTVLSFLLFIWSIKNKKEIIWFGISWFIISMLFVIKTMYVKPVFGASMSEWWVYLPSMGFFIILSNLLLSLFQKFKIAFIVIFLAIGIFWISLTVYNNTIWADELRLYQNNLKINPFDSDIRLNLANVYLDIENYEVAENEFYKVLELEPDSWEAYLGLGNILYRKDRLEEAIAMYRQCIKFKPTSPEAWNNLGLIYRKKGNQEAEIKSFLVALKCNSESDYIYANLGISYLNNGDYKEATDYFNKAIELNPDNDIYFSNLGVNYAAQNLIKEALVAFGKALEINPKSINAMFNLGNLYANTGHLDKAIKIWENALIIDPNNETIKNNLKIAKDLIK